MHCIQNLYRFQFYSDSFSGFTEYTQETKRAGNTSAWIGSILLVIATQSNHIKVKIDIKEYLQTDEKVMETIS